MGGLGPVMLSQTSFTAIQQPNGSALDNQAVEDTSRDAGSPKLKQNVVVLDPADYTGHCSFLRGLFAVPNSWTEITADFLEDAFRKVLTEMDYLAIQQPNGSALDNQAVEDTSRDAGSPKLKQNVVVLDPADYTGHCSFLRGLFAVPNSWTEITADFLEDAFRKVLTEMDYLGSYTSLAIQDYLAHYLSRHRGELNGTPFPALLGDPLSDQALVLLLAPSVPREEAGGLGSLPVCCVGRKLLASGSWLHPQGFAIFVSTGPGPSSAL
ncbi:uncharacterized protein LOC129346539 [Eublepharis macularius]|uniref:Uncharacterized protein LOC129346539 n=2 Tax=Eublepharis macularius TaxID=481883 RepID=A0AA97KQZ5_EUBMA|nr:uncharacterized protein LOC129346539 [Eublepharis macularius]